MKRINSPLNDTAVSELLAIRSSLELTQQDFGKLLGVSKQRIADYETFRTTVPAGILIEAQRIAASKPRKSSRKSKASQPRPSGRAENAEAEA